MRYLIKLCQENAFGKGLTSIAGKVNNAYKHSRKGKKMHTQHKKIT